MRFSLSTWVLIGFVAGITAGLFAGEYCAPLQTVGDVYIGLLQMTVLPYIVASLIVNLGRLDMSTCRRLAAAIAGVLAILWLLMSVIQLVLPMGLPPWQQGSFFSTRMLETPQPLNLLDLFIPTNPFQALAENVVPAAVLFSICVGIALIGVDNKQSLMDSLDALLRALGRINHAVALLSPLGVFAIMAATAGTMRFEDFFRLKAYLLIYVVGTLLLALLILPLLVASVTPIRFVAFLRAAWAPMLTAFATGKILVVLPMIAKGAAQLLEESGVKVSQTAKPDALVALGYPFPHLGKLMGLLFIPFAAWFAGSPMPWADYPSVLGAGLVSMFGSVVASIPFLLDLERLPGDLFQMFVASGVICGRLGDLLGVVSLLAFTILTTCVLEHRLHIRAGMLVSRGLAMIALLLVSVVAVRSVATPLVRNLPSKDTILLSMHSAVIPVPQKEWTPPPDTGSDPGLTRLQRIRRRGALRVGCLADNLPFSFRNEAGELAGFDIDMAHLLASDLDCELWLIPVTPDALISELDRDAFDLAMSGIVMTSDRLQAETFTRPYMHVTMSLVVADSRRREFSRFDLIQQMPGLRIAAMPSRQFENQLTRLFPKVEMVSISSPREFFVNPALADALLISAEAGSAWTLIYPSFTPVIPQPQVYRLPLGYPVAAQDRVFADFVSQWIELKTGSPEYRRVYDHWILGQGAKDTPPRWSILRNVLGVGSEDTSDGVHPPGGISTPPRASSD